MGHTFVGTGFGAIQGGLFLREASRSGNFDRLVVAEVMPDVVEAVRQQVSFSLNIATSSGIKQENILGVEILDAAVELNLPLTLHTAAHPDDPWGDVFEILKVVKARPDVRFNLAHTCRIRSRDAWQGEFRSVSEKAYAVLEGVAFELRRLVRETLGCSEAAALQVIGGGSHSDVWLQIIADTLGCPVTVGSGDSLLGAAAMARGALPGQSGMSRPIRPEKVRSALLDVRFEKGCAR